MASTAEKRVERRINGKQRELATDRGAIKRQRAIIENIDARSEELTEELRDNRTRGKRALAIIEDLEDGFRHGDPEEGKAWSSERLASRREELADHVEALRSANDGLLDRLDQLAVRSRKAERSLKEWIEERDDDRKRLNQLRRRRQKIEAKEGQLSDHFYVVEFDCRDGTPVPQISIKALEHLAENYLEPIRRNFGRVTINSGFRTTTYNRSIGGATYSIHVYDGTWQRDPYAVAADHVAAGGSPSQVQAFHRTRTDPDGLGIYWNFTHVDNRARIGWAHSRWVGP